MSQPFDDLYDQVQDLQETSDNNQPTLDALNNILQPDGTLRAQLDYPLDAQSTQEIQALFPWGSVALTAGAATVYDGRVSPSSVIIISRYIQGGTLGQLYIGYQSSGTFTINSSSSTETSYVNYLILNPYVT
jgi:hypothetical protein